MEAMISDETYIGVDKESNDGRKCGEFHDDKIEFSNNIKNLRNDVISKLIDYLNSEYFYEPMMIVRK